VQEGLVSACCGSAARCGLRALRVARTLLQCCSGIQNFPQNDLKFLPYHTSCGSCCGAPPLSESARLQGPRAGKSKQQQARSEPLQRAQQPAPARADSNTRLKLNYCGVFAVISLVQQVILPRADAAASSRRLLNTTTSIKSGSVLVPERAAKHIHNLKN
jgi:hypothetical protein